MVGSTGNDDRKDTDKDAKKSGAQTTSNSNSNSNNNSNNNNSNSNTNNRATSGSGSSNPSNRVGDSPTREEILFARVCTLLHEEIDRGSDGSLERALTIISGCPQGFAEALTLRNVMRAPLKYACFGGHLLEITGLGQVTGTSKATSDNGQPYFEFSENTWLFFLRNSGQLAGILSQMAGVIHPNAGTIERCLTTCWLAQLLKYWEYPEGEKRNESEGSYVRCSGKRQGDLVNSTYFLPRELTAFRRNLLTIPRTLR